MVTKEKLYDVAINRHRFRYRYRLNVGSFPGHIRQMQAMRSDEHSLEAIKGDVTWQWSIVLRVWSMSTAYLEKNRPVLCPLSWRHGRRRAEGPTSNGATI